MPFRLPAGPLTVFDDLGNAGEAMVTTMATDVRQLVSFSIDGELKIRHEGKPETVESYALAFNKTRFLLDEKKQRLRVHQYSIENRSNHSKPLLLEHPKPKGGWTINPSGDFEEGTDDTTRYRLEIKAKVSRDFVLQETLSETSQHSFESLTVDKLQDWLDSPVINAATKNRVGELLALHQRLTITKKQTEDIQTALKLEKSEVSRISGVLHSHPHRSSLADDYEAKIARCEARIAKLDADAEIVAKEGISLLKLLGIPEFSSNSSDPFGSDNRWLDLSRDPFTKD